MTKHKLGDFFEGVAGWLKIILLFFMMTMGFFFTYCMIWVLIGLPQETWSLLLMLGLACLTEFGYYKWIDG